jgi:hypothetical protein
MTLPDSITIYAGGQGGANAYDPPLPPPSSNNPMGMTTDNDNNIYIAYNGTNQIMKLVNGVATQFGPTFQSVQNIVFDGVEYFYVMDSTNNISQLDMVGNVTRQIQINDHNFGLAFYNGSLYYTNPSTMADETTSTPVVYKIDINNDDTTSVPFINNSYSDGSSDYTDPYSLTFDNNGNCYIVFDRNQYVANFNAAGNSLTQYFIDLGGLYVSQNIINTNNLLYVSVLYNPNNDDQTDTSLLNTKINVYNLQGQLIYNVFNNLETNLANPERQYNIIGMTISGPNLYASDFTSGNLYTLPLLTNVPSNLPSNSEILLYGVTTTYNWNITNNPTTGDLFFGNNTNNLYKFNTTGDASIFANTMNVINGNSDYKFYSTAYNNNSSIGEDSIYIISRDIDIKTFLVSQTTIQQIDVLVAAPYPNGVYILNNSNNVYSNLPSYVGLYKNKLLIIAKSNILGFTLDSNNNIFTALSNESYISKYNADYTINTLEFITSPNNTHWNNILYYGDYFYTCNNNYVNCYDNNGKYIYNIYTYVPTDTTT